jgi:hypothetical protein
MLGVEGLLLNDGRYLRVTSSLHRKLRACDRTE